MAQNIQAFPFDSQVQSYESDGTPIYDRATDSKGFRNLLKTYFKEGVFPNPSSNLQVVENGTLGVKVNKGSCMVGGVTILVNENVTLILDSAGTQNRIDRIVMRVDDTLSVRNAEIKVIKGSPSTSPTPPARTYNDTIKDIVLANVLVTANSSTITQSNITDTRPDSSICGWVAGTIDEIDYSVLFKQYESQFNTWFNQMKDKLSTDSAGKLQIEIDAIKEKTDYFENENILINSYFLKPVNQRGSVTYSYSVDDSKTIDMWDLYKATNDIAQVSVTNEGITLYSADLCQDLPSHIIDTLESGYYTLSAKLRGRETQSVTFYTDLGMGILGSLDLTADKGKVVYSIQFSRPTQYPRLSISDKATDASSYPIQFVKLEKGKKFTGFKPNYQKEFDECRRYFWRCTEDDMLRVPAFISHDKKVEMYVKYPFPMYKKPTIEMTFSPSTIAMLRDANGMTFSSLLNTQSEAYSGKNSAFITVTSSIYSISGIVGFVNLAGGYIDFKGDNV